MRTLSEFLLPARPADLHRLAPIALITACVLLLGCSNSSMAPSSSVRVNESVVDATVAPYIGTQTPGLSIAVGYHDRLRERLWKGRLQTGAAMTAQTRLGIGSVLKQMTSAALLTLARDKLLSIDDKANVLLPQYVGNRMTLRQMSTMSSGLQGAAQHPGGDELFGIVGAYAGGSTVTQVYAN